MSSALAPEMPQGLRDVSVTAVGGLRSVCVCVHARACTHMQELTIKEWSRGEMYIYRSTHRCIFSPFGLLLSRSSTAILFQHSHSTVGSSQNSLVSSDAWLFQQPVSPPSCFQVQYMRNREKQHLALSSGSTQNVQGPCPSYTPHVQEKE